MNIERLKKLELILQFKYDRKGREVISDEFAFHYQTMAKWFTNNEVPRLSGLMIERAFEKELKIVDDLERMINDQ